MTVPPNSVALVPCSVETKLETFVVEGVGVDLIVPMSLHTGEGKLRLAMLNPSDHSVKVRKGRVVGRAEEARRDKPVPHEFSPDRIVEGLENGTEANLPEHLHDLMERSRANLTIGEQQELSTCLRGKSGFPS
ncbi:hypothetical protein DPMN_089848 [Dreissena polymorpha]|uniref:Uncharacterized protein n=1 Tax=Dreissena polymorpha TaxID=45954 RepID=A0A9D4KWP0_DREPO|nr:hypothetical protein DPMN_089848 [Dreissena polymorpha]